MSSAISLGGFSFFLTKAVFEGTATEFKSRLTWKANSNPYSSPLLFNFEATSTILRIASEREGKSGWRLLHSSTIRKKLSETLIWNGRSWPSGFLGMRFRSFAMIVFVVLTTYTRLARCSVQAGGER
jgi:hypothetical protein